MARPDKNSERGESHKRARSPSDSPEQRRRASSKPTDGPKVEDASPPLEAAVQALLIAQLLRVKFYFDAPSDGLQADIRGDDQPRSGGSRLVKFAIVSNDTELLAYLLSHGLALSTVLHIAAKGGNSVCLERTLRAGALVDSLDKNGDSALHLAAERGHFQAVQVLLAWGARNVANDGHRTATEVADERCRNAINETQNCAKIL